MKRRFLLENGDSLEITEQAAVLTFAGPRAVLSTAAWGGGLRYDVKQVYNHCECGPAGVCLPMQGDNLRDHQRATALSLGLDPETVTGLNTAANLDNMVVATESCRDLWVTAAVSGGANVNALCAGDPATLEETGGRPCVIAPGTINIFLITGSDLYPGALGELLMVAAEAKAAVLRDLMQASSQSREIATGTGTDGTVIVAGCAGENRLINGGKHFKLGELAGKAVKNALREALFRQTGLCPGQQHSVLARLSRFGITEEDLARAVGGTTPEFRKALRRMDRDSFLISGTALYVHLLDEHARGMLSRGEAEDWGDWLLENLADHFSLSRIPERGPGLSDRLRSFLTELLQENLRRRADLYGDQPPI